MIITTEFTPITIKIETVEERNRFIRMLSRYEDNERLVHRWGYRTSPEAILANEIYKQIAH